MSKPQGEPLMPCQILANRIHLSMRQMKTVCVQFSLAASMPFPHRGFLFWNILLLRFYSKFSVVMFDCSMHKHITAYTQYSTQLNAQMYFDCSNFVLFFFSLVLFVVCYYCSNRRGRLASTNGKFSFLHFQQLSLRTHTYIYTDIIKSQQWTYFIDLFHLCFTVLIYYRLQSNPLPTNTTYIR